MGATKCWNWRSITTRWLAYDFSLVANRVNLEDSLGALRLGTNKRATYKTMSLVVVDQIFAMRELGREANRPSQSFFTWVLEVEEKMDDLVFFFFCHLVA